MEPIVLRAVEIFATINLLAEGASIDPLRFRVAGGVLVALALAVLWFGTDVPQAVVASDGA